MRYLIANIALALFLSSCGGGGGGSDAGASVDTTPDDVPCTGQCANTATRLSIADVKQVLAQAIAQAQAIGVDATIAIVDRVGNVLAVHRMAAVAQPVEIATTTPVTINAGLEGIVLPAGSDGDAVAAISKAITGAYLSSEGNAFSTRTANQIVQEHFNPGETDQPSGPLFGVQFSQLACSDFTQTGNIDGNAVGPQRSPLGLAADAGGLPLYKNGTPVGGVGVMADGVYGIDKNILDRDNNIDERIALAATWDFAAPPDRRADRITVEGKTLRFTDVDFDDLVVEPATATDYDSLVGVGQLVSVTGYGGATIVAGTAFGTPESGIRPADGFSGLDAFVFVDDSNVNRFPATAGGDGSELNVAALSANEVTQILSSALVVANRSRAQIRRPLGSSARVTISVVDTQGMVLGMVRSRDAPVFGADVSLQKARTATLFSSPTANAFLRSISEPAVYVTPQLSFKTSVSIATYADAVESFVGSQALSDGTAFSDRAGGNLSRPFFPDGIDGNPNGPFSKSFVNNEWSVFSTGLQLDIAINQLLRHVLFVLGAAPTDVGSNCTDAGSSRVANGLQIFPGSVPIFRGNTLVGGIGVSGDGVDQDDMIAFLGVDEASAAINNAPPPMRADQLAPMGERLRYVQCPQNPYIDSSSENVCRGK